MSLEMYEPTRISGRVMFSFIFVHFQHYNYYSLMHSTVLTVITNY